MPTDAYWSQLNIPGLFWFVQKACSSAARNHHPVPQSHQSETEGKRRTSPVCTFHFGPTSPKADGYFHGTYTSFTVQLPRVTMKGVGGTTHTHTGASEPDHQTAPAQAHLIPTFSEIKVRGRAAHGTLPLPPPRACRTGTPPAGAAGHWMPPPLPACPRPPASFTDGRCGLGPSTWLPRAGTDPYRLQGAGLLPRWVRTEQYLAKPQPWGYGLTALRYSVLQL